jgi:spermidine/putrescine transport system substrate-binding protein
MSDGDIGMDPAVFRGLTQRRLSRRDLLKYAGSGAGALGLGALLAACGVSGNKSSGPKAGSTGPSVEDFWANQKKQGVLNFANWPLYIDTAHGKHPSLEQFTEKTGIKVDYKAVIQNNDSFFAKISPTLKAGQSTGYDIIVLTNGFYLTQLIANGWLIPLDHSRLPNFAAHAGDAVKDPGYDPGNTFTVAWQSGMTGIGYNPKLTKRKISSVNDLFDPKFGGHIGMMSDNTELGSAALLKLGIDPEKSNPDDWRRAADVLQEQRGLVRQYYDQGYIKALQDGDTWITQAWSGDVFQSQNSGFPDLEFVVPDEGAMFWTDNMMIPKGAEHPLDALMWMDFAFRPGIAAEIADWVWYICPVPEAKDIIKGKLDDPTVANSPLVFPSSQMEGRFHEYAEFKTFDDFQEWNSIFDPIIQA